MTTPVTAAEIELIRNCRPDYRNNPYSQAEQADIDTLLRAITERDEALRNSTARECDLLRECVARRSDCQQLREQVAASQTVLKELGSRLTKSEETTEREREQVHRWRVENRQLQKQLAAVTAERDKVEFALMECNTARIAAEARVLELQRRAPAAFSGPELSEVEKAALKLCSDCPPAGYPTDETRCETCPLRQTGPNGECPICGGVVCKPECEHPDGIP